MPSGLQIIVYLGTIVLISLISSILTVKGHHVDFFFNVSSIPSLQNHTTQNSAIHCISLSVMHPSIWSFNIPPTHHPAYQLLKFGLFKFPPSPPPIKIVFECLTQYWMIECCRIFQSHILVFGAAVGWITCKHHYTM